MTLLARIVATSTALWGEQASRWLDTPSRRSSRLSAKARDFENALVGVPPQRANPVRAKIRRAASTTDFWHLRVAVFNAVSQSLGQHAAHERLGALNAMFVSRGPRTGPLPLDSRP